MTQQEVFDADLRKMNRALKELDALVVDEDGWIGIHPQRVPPALLSAYSALTSYGYANGLI